MYFWFAFPLWKVLSISSCLLAFCTSSFECLFSSFAHLFSGSLIFWSLVFWAPCILWLLIPCQTSSWQRFSLILQAVSSIWWLFPLLCRPCSFMQPHLSIPPLICWAIGIPIVFDYRTSDLPASASCMLGSQSCAATWFCGFFFFKPLVLTHRDLILLKFYF
jgi:hypothetical protein